MIKDLISTCQERRSSQIAVNIFNPTFIFILTLERSFHLQSPPPFYSFRPTAGLIDNLWHQPTSLFCQILLSFYLHFALLNNRISKLPFASLFRILLFTPPAVGLRSQRWHELENPRLENVSSWHQYQHHVQHHLQHNAQHEVLDYHLVYQIYWI